MSQPVLRGFDWDRGNHDKCLKHGVSVEDIEAVFAWPVVILPDQENPAGERRLKAIGTTPSGRHAFIVFTWRAERGGSAMMRQCAVHAQEGSRYL